MLIPKRHRRRRLLRLHSQRLQRRVIFVIGGLVVGAAAVGLALAADEAQAVFHSFQQEFPYAVLLLTPLGFAAIVYVTNAYFPNSQGSGIPQAIAARALRAPRDRRKLVSIRIAVGKSFLTLAALLCGASIGREGPTVQVGASIMAAIGGYSPRRQPGLILAGSCAGIAAAFNTPMAGIVFGIEEMSRSFESRTSGLIIGAIVAAGMTSLALFGNYTYFGSSSAHLPSLMDWVAVGICGVVGGLMGGIFSRILILFGAGFRGRFGEFVKSRPVLFAAACGLLVAICGVLTHGNVYGTGYEQAREVLHDRETLAWYFAPLKLLATALSSISGLPGGFFAPSLSVGAGIGSNLSFLFPDTPIGALVLLGMVAYFAGVVQAPITAFVIVAEMTDNHGMLVPLMLAALIARSTSRLVCKEGVYHALSHKFLAEAGPDAPLRGSRDDKKPDEAAEAGSGGKQDGQPPSSAS
ncbi:H+/Cl- antiporter ClcA [Parvibaculum indicum]|uniref:chloride channel protein n=1 Tax=Parvibaculum indicum TaxID=562969 RepID=UPI0014234801|nr:chloride channel protein [Parvibaculum indicum]NIJ41015.1 H+/Cl- antiporter ClcA [Parvibaculum indicum]